MRNGATNRDGQGRDALTLAERVCDLGRRAFAAEGITGLEEAIARARRHEVNVVVAGQFKRGKTTLINALLGRDLLPRAVTPLTSVITLVRSGVRDRAHAVFDRDERREIALEELADYVTEEGNPQNARGVRLVEVDLDAPLLRGGLVLVDTPGTGSIHRHNTEVARGFLPRADAALFVVSADPVMSEEERRELAAVRASVPFTVCVLNKVDQVAPPDRQAALSFTRRQLASIGGQDVPVLAVSALQALVGGSRADGVEALRDLLIDLAVTRGQSLTDEGLRLRALATLEGLESALALQVRAAELGADEARRRLVRFRAIAQEIERALDDQVVTARERASRALREKVEPRLEASARASGREIDTELVARAGDPSFAGRVEDWVAGRVADAVDRWSDEARGLVATHVAPVLAETVASANDLRRRALVESAALLELAPPPVRAISPDVETDVAGLLRLDEQATGALELMAVALRRRLPGPLGRRTAIRAARERARELIDQHSGRLRAALRVAVSEACRAMAGRHRRTLVETLRTLERAFEGAREMEGRSADEGARVARERAALLSEAQSLRDALGRTPPAGPTGVGPT